MGDYLNFDFKCKILKEEKELNTVDLLCKYLIVFLAESTGTGMLLFWGCSALTPGNRYSGGLTVGIMILACVVGICVQIFGPISMCHINPAVTLSFWILGYISIVMVFVYIIAQCVGATIGFAIFRASHHFAPDGFCCTTLQGDTGILQGLAWEFLSTSFLAMMVCTVVDPRNAQKMDAIPIKFAIVIFIGVYMAAPYTGGSLNPARTMGPAIIDSCWDDIWIYWIGPLLGSAFATVFYHIFFLPKSRPVEDVDM